MKLGQLVSFLGIIIGLLILWKIRQLLLILFTAIVLATALNSLVQRLRRAGLRRGQAVPIVISGSFLVTTLFVYLIVPPFISQILQLALLVPEGFSEVVNWVENLLNQRPSWLTSVELPSPSEIIAQIQPVLRVIIPNFFAIFSDSIAVLVQALFLVILTLMLLANPTAYRQAFIQIFPAFYRLRADTILSECEIALNSWIGGALISSTVVASLSAIGLWALQIKFVFAQALLAGLLNFIPNLGPTLSMIFPLTVAATEEPWKVIAVVIIYIVIQNLEAYLITPTIMANQVSLLPAMTLAAQIAFASFFGFMGLLLALPLTVIAKVLLQEILIKDIMNKWGSDSYEAPPDPPEQMAMVSPAALPANLPSSPKPAKSRRLGRSKRSDPPADSPTDSQLDP